MMSKVNDLEVMIGGKPIGQVFSEVKKRDGRIVPFDISKISRAIYLAMNAIGEQELSKNSENLAQQVVLQLYQKNADNHTPEIEEIQDIVENILMQSGYEKTAKAYILYRKQREILRKKKALAKKPTERETTDYALFVRTSDDDYVAWDRQRIIKALIDETPIVKDIAEKIALEAEDTILNSDIKVLTSDIIREIVNGKLLEHGYEDIRLSHSRVGLSMNDLEKIILFANKENANVPHNPEATNMSIAEHNKKVYALARVFSRDVADAHTRGDLHLHDLGFCDRPYCSGQSLAYIEIHGLNLPNSMSNASPAKHADVLLAHHMKFSAALQGNFAGAIGWDAVNIFYAPYLEGKDDREIKQLAQMLLFEYSQQAVARGGQAIFSDLNFYWEIPKHFRDVEAIGPGGKPTGKTYKEYEKLAQKFAWAVFEKYLEGDSCNRPFFFPKPLVHITEEFFRTDGHQEFLELICKVASEKGNTYFVFDRGETAKISECCRLSFKLSEEDLKEASNPSKMRYTALQNITINLPRIAYEANGDTQKLYEILDRKLDMTIKGHEQKKVFIEKLLSLKHEGPLSMLSMEKEKGEPYLRLNRASYLVGLLGLNEMVQAHTGKQLHESEEAFNLALEIIAYMHLKLKKVSQEKGMKFVLEQTPAESASHRFARLDLEHFLEKSKDIVKGDKDTGSVYYTNSTQLNISHTTDPLGRAYLEGKMHDLIEAGAITHIWLGESKPSEKSLANVVKKFFKYTRNAQVAFSPEFTSCNICDKVQRGINTKCGHCGSENVDYITRVTGYFSKVSGWNKGKKAELKDRYKNITDAENVIPVSEIPKNGFEIYGLSPTEFVNKSCQKCDDAKRLLQKEGIDYTFHNIQNPKGLARLHRYDLQIYAEKALPIMVVNGNVYTSVLEAVRAYKNNGGSGSETSKTASSIDSKVGA